MSLFTISDEVTTEYPRPAPDVVVLVVSGEIDYGASPRLRERLHDEIHARKQHLVIDLSAVTFIDSMAVGVLVGAVTRLHETGGSLRVVCSEENDRVLRIFDIAGVANLIQVHHSRLEALAALNAPSEEGTPWLAQTLAIAAPHGEPGFARDTPAMSAARKYDHDAAVRTDGQPGAAMRRGSIDELA